MPFGLNNVGATYQLMMTRMFRDKIRHIVEVYIDVMVVTSKKKQGHIDDLWDISYVSTLTSVPLEWGLASSSGICLLTEE